MTSILNQSLLESSKLLSSPKSMPILYFYAYEKLEFHSKVCIYMKQNDK